MIEKEGIAAAPNCVKSYFFGHLLLSELSIYICLYDVCVEEDLL